MVSQCGMTEDAEGKIISCKVTIPFIESAIRLWVYDIIEKKYCIAQKSPLCIGPFSEGLPHMTSALGGGGGSPKSRGKGENLLISVCDKKKG